MRKSSLTYSRAAVPGARKRGSAALASQIAGVERVTRETLPSPCGVWKPFWKGGEVENSPAARKRFWTTEAQGVTKRLSGKPDQPKGIGDNVFDAPLDSGFRRSGKPDQPKGIGDSQGACD